MLSIPVTSSDTTTSSLTFNKSYCKDIVAGSGVKVARSCHLIGNTSDGATEIREKLTFPLFIKPNNGGSSVGMSKVNGDKDLEAALERAFHEDNEVLAEEFIAGRELTCGVIRTGGEVIALPVTEIISKKDYFDYEAKYTKGMADEVVPANIPESLSVECRKISMMLYRKLNCRGVVRFDYIYNGNDFYFLEVNTVPGLTSASIVPNMAKACGWSFTELITRLLNEVL
jgi:D-alanine-D-alanine ligase